VHICIGNLHPDTSAEQLRRLLADVDGEAQVTCVEQQTADGPLCYGYAVMRSTATAQRAIDELNGVELHGRPLRVREFIERCPNGNRRAPDSDERPWYGPERRIVERRTLVRQVVRHD